MKKVLYLLACSSMLFSSVSFAEDSQHEFSANVALSTDYMYRGGSQTDEQTAISGGFDYGHTSGFYAGVWASNVDFQDIGLPSSNIEIDYYGGVAGEFSNGISWDVGGLYYHYAGTKDAEEAAYGGDADFVEAYGSLGYTFSDVQFEPSVGVFFAWSPDYFGESGDSYYTAVDLGLSLPYGISLAGQIGFQEFDRAGVTDYSHYSVGLSKDVAIFTLDATYYDSIDDADTFWGAGFEEAIVFTVSSSF
ncbi:MAG: hypothetical protein HND53_05135 [Proteobacteria bacterium]|nr:hypothetical protein [Pseudomonadota bacterium]NOG59865.1 hypothetical protein [Pseudomonadota bacterium]